jgi:hypothetical protein
MEGRKRRAEGGEGVKEKRKKKKKGGRHKKKKKIEMMKGRVGFLECEVFSKGGQKPAPPQYQFLSVFLRIRVGFCPTRVGRSALGDPPRPASLKKEKKKKPNF